MAKLNVAYLYGQVLKEPKIMKNDETGEYIRGVCPIVVVRGIRDFGNNVSHIKYDTPLIMTGNPVLVESMSKWKKGDMVEIKGAVTTKDVNKSSFCTHCNKKNTKKGNVVFVSPIYMSIRERELSTEEGTKLLKQRCEISNQALLIGTLCREPKGFRTEKGLSITTFQLAVSRKFKIKEDSPDTKTDFPWVKSYGVIAENDFKSLKKGTYVFVEGMIQTRELERVQVCEHCGCEYTWKDSAMEIVPYATEYLRNFKTKEELEALDAAEYKKAIQKIFSENDIEKPSDPPEDVS